FEAQTLARLSAVVQASTGAAPGNATAGHTLSPLSPMGQRFFSATRVETAFFLGPSNRQVFAVYHSPVEAGNEVLTVICPPLFNEYMRTQLALRELAISLAEKGQHVVRFDYQGTGDSFGELDRVAMSDSLEDIALVIRKGRELSGRKLLRL